MQKGGVHNQVAIHIQSKRLKTEEPFSIACCFEFISYPLYTENGLTTLTYRVHSNWPLIFSLHTMCIILWHQPDCVNKHNWQHLSSHQWRLTYYYFSETCYDKCSNLKYSFYTVVPKSRLLVNIVTSHSQASCGSHRLIANQLAITAQKLSLTVFWNTMGLMHTA